MTEGFGAPATYDRRRGAHAVIQLISWVILLAVLAGLGFLVYSFVN
jgi:hypothetical protein